MCVTDELDFGQHSLRTFDVPDRYNRRVPDSSWNSESEEADIARRYDEIERLLIEYKAMYAKHMKNRHPSPPYPCRSVMDDRADSIERLVRELRQIEDERYNRIISDEDQFLSG